MEKIEYFTLEVKEHDVFKPYADGEKFNSVQDAVSSYIGRSFIIYDRECCVRVVHHIHCCRVIFELSNFGEDFKPENYED